MAAIGAFISYGVMTFYEPILAIRLEDFHLSTQQIGFMFMVMPICQVPVALSAQWIPSWMEKRAVTITSCFFLVPALLCNGPSDFLNLPESLVILGVG